MCSEWPPCVFTCELLWQVMARELCALWVYSSTCTLCMRDMHAVDWMYCSECWSGDTFRVYGCTVTEEHETFYSLHLIAPGELHVHGPHRRTPRPQCC